ncbi:organic solute transporter subunit beta [Microcaecilia unicolor]|uniref:Organic solute transporter subunit beta-like n=1 Tax=Microcaecilia unicolor TaxID=1415580 RepID=A0A6P7X650_9AMPH|nr:organic solute transporter subunit beta-like [Microcaecilia unicolor]XP_030045619.1 organic solute transporter subunit beta-like [Microcaecilia unicolor]
MLSTRVTLIWMATCTLVPALTQDTRGGFESAVNPNARSDSDLESTVVPGTGMSEEELQQLLWIYRTQDPSAWNYSMLAISLAGLFLGLLILGMNIMANRNQKIVNRYKTELEATRTMGAEKQATLTLKDDDSLKQDPFLDTVQTQGKITVRWKDGHVTSLYKDTLEETV